MPNIITHKRSSTSGVVPAATGLSQGELAINIADGRLYTKNNTNTIINLGVTSISGTYITPTSGNFSNSLKVNGIEVSVSGHSHQLAPYADSLVTTVFNNTGSNISKFSVVYIDGGQGDQPTVNLAIANNESGSSKTYGVTSEAISNMSSGIVIVAGSLTGVNTDQFNPTAPVGNVNGSALWLSPLVSGNVTLTKPSAPNHAVYVGTIVRTHQNEGIIEVRIQNGFELEELHNVAIGGVANGQFLQYNSGSGLWFPSSSGNFTNLTINNSPIVTGTGISNHIPYWNSSSGIVADSGQLYWDSTNNRLGIGTASPQDFIHVSGATSSAVGIRLENNDGYGGSISADNGALYVFSNNNTNVFSVQNNKIRMNAGGATATAIELTSAGSISQQGNGGGLTFSGTTAQFSNGVNVTGSGLFSGDVRTSGSFIGAAGTALLPSFEFVNDPDTGMFSPATNTIGLATSGVERLRINNIGNIGISYSAPTTKLQVNGTFSCGGDGGDPASGGQGLYVDPVAPLLRIIDAGPNYVADIDANGLSLYDLTSLPFFYTDRANARIGIGANSPGSPLTISTAGAAGTIGGASQTQVFQVNDASSSDYVNLGHFNCEAGNSRGSFMLSNNGTNGAWEDNVIQFLNHGANYPYGYYGGNLSDAGCAMIVTQGSDIVKLQIGNYNAAPIELFTDNTFRMIVDTVGNVGIGTTTPNATLHVVGSGLFTNSIQIGDPLSPDAGTLNIYTNDSSDFSATINLKNGSSQNRLSIAVNDDTASSEIISTNDVLYITNDTRTINITANQIQAIGNLDVAGNLTFDSFTESVVANGNSGTSKTLSLASGTVHTCTLTGNCTFTMPTATAGKSFSLFLNSGSGNYTATFTGVRWADSASPTATITPSKVDIYSFISDGSYWYGSFSQNYG